MLLFMNTLKNCVKICFFVPNLFIKKIDFSLRSKWHWLRFVWMGRGKADALRPLFPVPSEVRIVVISMEQSDWEIYFRLLTWKRHLTIIALFFKMGRKNRIQILHPTCQVYPIKRCKTIWKPSLRFAVKTWQVSRYSGDIQSQITHQTSDILYLLAVE